MNKKLSILFGFQDDSETCMFCMVIVKDVEGFVKENKTEVSLLRKQVSQTETNRQIEGESNTMEYTFLARLNGVGVCEELHVYL